MSRDRTARKPSPPKKTGGKAHDDPHAMKLAETTDVSPNQAKELLRKHGTREATKRAKNFKAEG